MSVESQVLRAISQLNEYDTVVDRHGLSYDQTYPDRLGVAGYAITAVLRAREVYLSSAVSYRDKHVGCAAVAFDHDLNRIGILTGANFKVDETDVVNIHAEDVSYYKAEQQKFDQIPIVAVVGTPQEDHGSGRSSTTLHPCGKCRPKIAASPLTTRHTQILSATPSLEHIEGYTIEDLIALHDRGDASGIVTLKLQPDAADWDGIVAPYLTHQMLKSIT